MGLLPDREFRRCVRRYEGDRRLREFSCRDPSLTMAWALTGLPASLYQILQVLGITLFEKPPILRAFKRAASQPEMLDPRNQPTLLNL